MLRTPRKASNPQHFRFLLESRRLTREEYEVSYSSSSEASSVHESVDDGSQGDDSPLLHLGELSTSAAPKGSSSHYSASRKKRENGRSDGEGIAIASASAFGKGVRLSLSPCAPIITLLLPVAASHVSGVHRSPARPLICVTCNPRLLCFVRFLLVGSRGGLPHACRLAAAARALPHCHHTPCQGPWVPPPPLHVLSFSSSSFTEASIMSEAPFKRSRYLWKSFASANLRNAVSKDINEHSAKKTDGFFASPKQDVFVLTPKALKLIRSAPDYQTVREREKTAWFSLVCK